ncbi:MAG TPA: diphosphate--fructose-6-phosphate 1-phosphotransferase [Armatimonadota bacterium]|jgi:6-phosphofructokinase 1
MANGRSNQGRVGILVGGGPAPGINNVIGAATNAALRQGLEVIGILDGFKWLARGDTNHVLPLTATIVDAVRLRGGSLLHTSRENPTGDEAKLRRIVQALEALDIRYLVTIGGDDTAFSASKVAQQAHGAVHVAHVPKTIDNDLPLPGNMPTFGFQTARHIGGQLVANLMEDARTTQRWYIVVAMGRSAGHLALGMGYSSGATLSLLPEEFTEGTVSLDLLCRIIEGAIFKARAAGQQFGAAVVAEGIAERMKEEMLHHPLVQVQYDDHGHLRLAEVPFALILKRALEERAQARGDTITLVDVAVGYELRCADPISFDIEYTQQLGWGAVRYLLHPVEEGWTNTGAMISVQSGEVIPIPFSDILDPDTGRTSVRRMNLHSDTYRCARTYMTRLERGDFRSKERVAELAAAAGMNADDFRAQYLPTVEY